MNLVTDINTFDSNNVYFLDSVKNTIMNDSNFIRIIYSNHLFMLNGIFLKISLKITNLLNEKRESVYQSFGAQSQLFSQRQPGSSLALSYGLSF